MKTLIHQVSFDERQFNRLFPFHLLLDRTLRIESIGRTMKKIFPVAVHDEFLKQFRIKAPGGSFSRFESLRGLVGQPVLVDSFAGGGITLHGEFHYLPEKECLLFIGSPLFASMAEVNFHRLDTSDFAIQHPVVDLLQQLSEQKSVNEKIEGLYDIVKKQKDELTRTSLVASANKDGVLFTGESEQIVWVNDGFTRLTGFTAADAMGKTPVELCAGELTSREDLKQMIALFRAGEDFEFDLVFYRKDRSHFWGRVKGQSVSAETRNEIQYFAILEDITRHKLLEQQLIEAKRDAERSAHTKELFLANMSHEIRTPMNAILGMSRQLQKTSLDNHQQSFLDIIGCATEHLLVIINDILDLSKLEAGKTSLEEIGFSIHDLLLQASKVLRLKVEEKQLVLDTYCDPAIPAVLLGDPHRINQVVINLLSNAVKFTQKGKVTLSCRLLATTGNRQELEIVVTDTGKGMEASFLKSLFNKFSQEDQSIARSYGGTGLGLSIVKQLVELMGGTISIASKKSQGTIVTLHLSFVAGDEKDLPVKADFVMAPEALRGKKILLVEDNQMNRIVAQTMLKDYGLSITEAIDGSIAVNLVKSNAFDLILMDMQMPIMDGIEATKRIRKHTNVPIIALTANAIKGERDRCLAAGMDDYLSKPFEEEDLIGMLAKWLGVQTGTIAGVQTTVPETNGYEIGQLRKIARGNEKVIVSLLQAFIAETQLAISDINGAFETDDIKRMKAAAHRIKPSLTTLFLFKEIDVAKRIESGSWKAKNRSELKGLVKEFSNGIEKIIQCIMADFPPTRVR